MENINLLNVNICTTQAVRTARTVCFGRLWTDLPGADPFSLK